LYPNLIALASKPAGFALSSGYGLGSGGAGGSSGTSGGGSTGCFSGGDGGNEWAHAPYTGGYFNTTAAITGLSFKFESGNIDSGTIDMYGIS
jgi:hypothetical protein